MGICIEYLTPMKLYSTGQVADMLSIPIWRVKNFTEGKAFGIEPTQVIGEGHGGRRLYDDKAVRKISTAALLTQAGLRPEIIGGILSSDDPGGEIGRINAALKQAKFLYRVSRSG